ncbi:hypothetical protein [Streptomyces sp. CBMA156]|uniref:hypothetical protein n=1 Tax=Streptomyces sp. CBMA156 TaxID=1930280 RepID=UPI001661ED0A|nr:hypothetical protein [Streptomyces sp. CBMA156]MBD0670223.1 hypothetical protein [Streptomyces sp. CBMA156]
MSRRTVLTACAVAVCVAAGGAAGYTATAGRGPARDGSTRTDLPVQAYLLTYQQRDDLNSAYERLVERCMRDRGAPIQPLTHVRPPLKDFLERRYGLTDLEQAERYGYGLPPTRDAAAAPAPPELTEAQRLVYDGGPGEGPSQGCVGWAVQQIGDTARVRETPVAMELQRKSWDASAKDPRVVAATARWSACMSALGYHVSSPVDTAATPTSDQAAERALAASEVRCSRSSGVVREWFAVEAAYQDEMIERNKDALLAERSAALRVVNRAHAVLDG